MLKSLTLSALTLLFFNGCNKEYARPKLTEISPKTKKLPKRAIRYTINKDGTVTLKIREAKWILGKLNRATKNSKILKIANKALNEEIRKNNSF